tara:strand:+ start:59 stop:673 length:615 start_codon:yes stop_codon:yes gene_type:complete
MKRLLLLTAIFLTACGPSQEEKQEIATIACNVMENMTAKDGARIKEVNAARQAMGEEPFFMADDSIHESFEYELCEELVLNNVNYESLKVEIDAKRQLAQVKKQEELESGIVGIWLSASGTWRIESDYSMGVDDNIIGWRADATYSPAHFDIFELGTDFESEAIIKIINADEVHIAYCNDGYLRCSDFDSPGVRVEILKREPSS